MVVGKCFNCCGILPEDAWLEMEKEYLNLKLLRERFGMNTDANKVVAPLGINRELSALLVTEMASGQTLDHYVAKAIFEEQHHKLPTKLGYLARFLVHLHSSSETDRPVSPDLPRWYLDKLLNSLMEGPLGWPERNAIEGYAALWWDEDSISAEDREVVVHGDANPTNFFFHDENVIAVDLEGMKWADRCWAMGFIAAELKHHFMWRTGDGWAAEPYIGHFLREYAADKGENRFFNIITSKLPLYMALGLLRIARHPWLGEAHRKALTMEAKQCLEYGL